MEKSVTEYHTQPIPKRILALTVVLLLIFVAGIVQLVNVQLIGATQIENTPSEAYKKTTTVPANRGSIYDNSGTNVFAKSVFRYDVSVDQTKTKDWYPIDCAEKHIGKCNEGPNGEKITNTGVLGLAQYLGYYLGIPTQQLAFDLYGEQKHKVIAEKVTPDIAHKVENLLIPFVAVDRTTTRQYPQGNLAGSEIGSAIVEPDGSTQAYAGMEYAADDLLAGEDGLKSLEVGGLGERIPMGDETIIKEVRHGLDVKSSIDSNVQRKLQQIVTSADERFKAQWVFAGVMKIKTGEIVAIGSNNEPNISTPEGESDVREHGSQVMSTSFEPGSTIKALTASGLINEGLVSPEDRKVVPTWEMDAPGAPGEKIHDASHHGSGPFTFAGIIGNSFNTGTVLSSANWPFQNRYDTFRRFGIGRLTGSGFPGEAQGLFAKPEDWDGRQRDTILFGQGLTASVLQLMNAYASIGRDGVRFAPTFVSATRDQGTSSWSEVGVPEEKEQVVSATAAQQVRGILESCVEKSGCRNARIDGYRIGGKTGTAEELTEGTLVHSFIGMFPMDDPQFIVSVYVNEKAGIVENASLLACFKELATFVIQKYGVNPSPPAPYIYPPT
jgi:cell division protein FtsI (penicillin-binding protein 3)